MENINIKHETTLFSEINNGLLSNAEKDHQISAIQHQLNITNEMNVELNLKLEALKREREEQVKHFDNNLRKIENKAKGWKTKFQVALEKNGRLKDRIHDLELQSPDVRSKPHTKRSKILRSNENNVFEVDALLKHKKKGDKIYYLIHWKNFDSTQDSWEREDNLNCGTILNRYKKMNKLL